MLANRSEKTIRSRRQPMARMLRTVNQRGFTLVELMVVLVIMVLLFALLFAPMMVGLDLVTQARVRTNMQDSLRLAMEQVRRDVSDAIYVYPTPVIELGGADGSLSTKGDNSAVADYSQVVIIKARRDGNGQLVAPIQAEQNSYGDMLAVRYIVKPVDSSQIWSADNVFALYRQEGYYWWDDTESKYIFGRRDSSGVLEPDVPEVENALTPTTGTDIPPTSTVCRLTGDWVQGYLAEPDPAWGAAPEDLVYLHSGIRIVPERVEGETLAAAEYNTLYTAKYSNWRGFADTYDDYGFFELPPAAALDQLKSAMQPRIKLYRWNDTDGSYSNMALDSYDPSLRSNVKLQWSPEQGQVRVGDYEIVRITVDTTATPTRGGGQFYPLTITDLGDAANEDSYDSNGVLSGSRQTSVVPIYGSVPTAWQDPLMPIAFAVYADDADGTAATAPAKVVPNSAHVRVVAGDVRRAEYTLTDVFDQEEIGQYQFAQLQAPYDRHAEIRLNRWDPPSPEAFGTPSSFYIDLVYYYRRNFDPTTNNDDLCVVDYSTAEVMNISLALSQFVDPEPYQVGSLALSVPSNVKVNSVVMHDQVQVRNLR